MRVTGHQWIKEDARKYGKVPEIQSSCGTIVIARMMGKRRQWYI